MSPSKASIETHPLGLFDFAEQGRLAFIQPVLSGGEGTDIAHPEFIECMSESMMTVMFPPPDGGGMVHVSYPFVFEPG